MKTEVRILISIAVVILIVVAIAFNYNSKNSYSATSDIDISDIKPKEVIQLTEYLELSNLSLKEENTIISAMGEITNNYSETIDEIGRIGFYDENGELIRVKAISVTLSPGESMLFEEMVGLSKEIKKPAKVKLSNFTKNVY